MYVCLNRGTTGAGLPLDQFVTLAAEAGFQGADVDMGYARQHGAAALRDLYAERQIRFGGWAPPVDHRTDPARRKEGLDQLAAQARIAREVNLDSCATWIMPSADL